jgi:hypothetical protein
MTERPPADPAHLVLVARRTDTPPAVDGRHKEITRVR